MNDFLSTNQLGELLGLSPPTIRRLQVDGVIAKRGRGFPIVETVRSYVAHLRNLRQSPASGRPGEPFVFETVRLDDGRWVFDGVDGTPMSAWLQKQNGRTLDKNLSS